MVTIFFVDSENVGDTWFDLLEYPNSRLVVFYTVNTPRITYEQAIRLINAVCRPVFVECYPGNNGLDFQLVSCLGYELHVDQSREMIIISKDTGFDAAVKFWRDRGMNVRRCMPSELTTNYESADKLTFDTELTLELDDMSKEIEGVDIREIYTIVNCIGKENLPYINIAFTHFYGISKGGNIYNFMKNRSFEAPYVNWKSRIRMKKLIEMIFSNLRVGNLPALDELTDFLTKNLVKDRKMMKQKLEFAYPEMGNQLHKVLKPFYPMLVSIKTDE